MGRRFSPVEKEKVLSYWKTGDYSQRELAELFNCGKGTIGRICKGVEKGKGSGTRPKEPQSISPLRIPFYPPPPMTSPLCPLAFKRHKLREISSDIEAARARGSVHTLPPLHKLQLSLFEEIVKLEKPETPYDKMLRELSFDVP